MTKGQVKVSWFYIQQKTFVLSTHSFLFQQSLVYYQ